MGRAWYNEIDPYAAQWLRNLIAAGEIAPGDVDERDIRDVRADDLRGYTQCHFFAGIGGWSVALRLAGWPDDRPVWTGSCPCQPFSAAGAGKAADDERHLWPAWASLIAECRPGTVFGEQVEAAIGWGWLDAVFADLEAQGYACGAAVLPAASVGAPHIRNRLWFVADHTGAGRPAWPQRDARANGWQAEEPRRLRDAGLLADADGPRPGEGRGDVGEMRGLQEAQRQPGHGAALPRRGGADGLLADADRRGRREQPAEHAQDSRGQSRYPDGGSGTRPVADADGGHAGAERLQRGGEQRQQPQDGGARELGITAGAGLPQRERVSREASGENGAGARQAAERRSRDLPFWADVQWLPCTDGKARPIEPGTFPLAHGVQRRPSKLRAYGNAIVPQVAAEFVRAVA